MIGRPNESWIATLSLSFLFVCNSPSFPLIVFLHCAVENQESIEDVSRFPAGRYETILSLSKKTSPRAFSMIIMASGKSVSLTLCVSGMRWLQNGWVKLLVCRVQLKSCSVVVSVVQFFGRMKIKRRFCPCQGCKTGPWRVLRNVSCKIKRNFILKIDFIASKV